MGDDAQSIYAFRGANINNILNFQKDYDNVKLFRLEQNYRSTKNIVNAANSIIEKNQTKLEKVVWTANEEGPKIIVNRSLTDGDEGRYIASTIFDNKMQNQAKNGDFAVLYRTNAQSRSIEDALRKRGLEYRIYGGLSFYQRKEIKDVLSYLRIIINPSDEEALKRIINFPGRGIGQTTIDRLIVSANEHDKTIFEILKHLDELPININAGTKTKLQNFRTMIESFKVMSQTANAFDLAEHVCKVSGLIQEFKKDGTPEGISRTENIEELLNGIKDFVEGQQELADSTGSIAEFLEDVALATDLDNEEGEDSDKVALMTIHLAKGLEFPFVYIVGLEEDLFPSAMSMSTREELEEERRLFYVALTRAEKQAYLTYALSRYRWGKLVDSEPSRFIEEIDDQYLEIVTPKEERRFNPMLSADIFGDVDTNTVRYKKPAYMKKKTKTVEKFKISTPKNLKKVSETNSNSNVFDTKLIVGDVVNHQRFGKGNVLSIEGKAADLKAEIKFETGGVKKLLLRFAKLEIIS